jgi:hypothetical protein
LFGMELEFKGYSWSFWIFSNYWKDWKWLTQLIK